MSQQLWGPALEAELEYRRELAARAYRGRPARPSRAARAWRRTRAWFAARREEHSGLVAVRARDAAARLGDTLDTIAARTDATAWQQRVADGNILFQDVLRPTEGVGRRAA